MRKLKITDVRKKFVKRNSLINKISNYIKLKKTETPTKKLQHIRQQLPIKVKVKMRRNFLPMLIAILISWIIILGIIYYIDPDIPGAVIIFLVMIFFSCLLTFSMLLINTRRGILASCTVIFILILRYFGVGTFINCLLAIGIVIVLDYYLQQS